MEAPDYFHGGYFHAAIAQYSPEKKAAGAGERNQFVVEDLLDFSNEEQEEDEGAAGALVSGDEGGLDAAAAWNSTDESTVSAVDSCSNSLCGGDAHLAGDLLCRSFDDTTLSVDICQPHYDEIAELEWLSNFVDESSFSSDELEKIHVNSGVPSTADAAAATAPSASPSKVTAASAALPCDASQPLIFRTESPIPGKARGKRSRVAPCSWASRLLVLPPSTNVDSSPESELLVPPSSGTEHVRKKAAKEKDPTARAAFAPTRDGRKCLHCQTDKTPQWRTGPMGPKTLCNACGVRYKSGRLVPEYRPAASPTFVLSKHSNSHRKVLELRRQKELIFRQQQLQIIGSSVAGGELYDPPPPMAVATDDFLLRPGFGPDLRRLI